MEHSDAAPWEIEAAPCAPAPRRAKRAHPDFLEVTTHKFKSNIAHYIRPARAKNTRA